MRLSAGTSRARPVVVPFEGGELNVTYRPSSQTPKQLAKLQAKAKKAAKEAEKGGGDGGLDSLVDSLLNTLVSWDLEDDDGAAIPLTAGALQDVPINILGEVAQAIGRDQQAGEALAP